MEKYKLKPQAKKFFEVDEHDRIEPKLYWYEKYPNIVMGFMIIREDKKTDSSVNMLTIQETALGTALGMMMYEETKQRQSGEFINADIPFCKIEDIKNTETWKSLSKQT